jgi:hypothetical protein
VEAVMIEEDRKLRIETTAAARLDIAATRQRMSGTVAELERQISGKIDAVKQKADLGALVRQHPWPALAAAFVAGVALSATGADRRAARATARAAKHAPDAAKRGASATAAGVSQLASAAVDRIRGSAAAAAAGADDGMQPGGLKAKASGVLQAQVRELREEVGRGADELAGAARPPSRSAQS